MDKSKDMNFLIITVETSRVFCIIHSGDREFRVM